MTNGKEKKCDSSFSPSVSNIKDPKYLKNYVEETMEPDSYDWNADDDNTVFEEFVPK